MIHNSALVTSKHTEQSTQPNREIFEDAVRALESAIPNAGVHLIIDTKARVIYRKRARAMSSELRSRALAGKITWLEAAKEAQQTRNIIMGILRQQSTAVGRAFAEKLKRQGKNLNELIGNKTTEIFGESANFHQLTEMQRNRVYANIVKAAGKSRPSINRLMYKLSRAARGLIFLSVALSIYAIATADNKVRALEKEASITGASVVGGMAGGAIAGLACGPGAPVCVTVGAFVGGALAAFGVSICW